MKKFIATILAATTVCSTQAQFFTPEGLTGAAIGGLAGAVIGHNSGRKTAEGAGIGAGIGAGGQGVAGHAVGACLGA